jgi:DNA-binding transcriptional LysR family regulator
MTGDELAALFPLRRPVTQEQFDLAASAWRAFTSPDPGLLQRLCQSDTSALPHLSAAVRRFLQQYPSTRDGLSRTEHQILQVVSEGASTMGAAFRADQRLDDPQFMGDATFARYLRGLGACRNPLLHVDEHGTLMKITLRLTAAGRNVLEGRSDHIALNGIDRWLGGVHLSDPGSVWRWNGSLLVR